MTAREEFVNRWERYLGGALAFGTAKARIVLVGAFTGNTAAEQVLAELQTEARQILGRLYDDAIKHAARETNHQPVRK